jgi:hypothetical protein
MHADAALVHEHARLTTLMRYVNVGAGKPRLRARCTTGTVRSDRGVRF